MKSSVSEASETAATKSERSSCRETVLDREHEARTRQISRIRMCFLRDTRPSMSDIAFFGNYRCGSRLSPEKTLKLVPGQAIKDVCSSQTGPPRLIEAAAHEIQFSCAVRIG